MATAITKQQWIQSLRQDAWIEVDAATASVSKVEAAIASLAAKAKKEAKPKLAPVVALQGVSAFPVAPIHLFMRWRR